MVTQKDIARRLGVSGSLVSHVLGGRGPRIGASAQTIRRIEAEAARQGYQRSAVALALRGQSTRLLGVVVKDFEDPYLGHLVGELQRLARESGYALLVTGCEGGAIPTPVLAPLNRYPLDGILLAGSDVGGAWFSAFARQGVSGVQIGTGARIPGMHRVCADEDGAMALATEHLIGLGHRRIGFAGLATGAHRRRQQAHLACLRRAGLEPMRSAAWQGADLATLELSLARGSGLRAARVSAVVGADDDVALRVLHAAHLQGLCVPGALSVTGMDDIPPARLLTPALTTVRQPLEAMVQAAFHHLVSQGPASPRRPLVDEFLPVLVVRETTAAPGAKESQPGGGSRRRSNFVAVVQPERES